MFAKRTFIVALFLLVLEPASAWALTGRVLLPFSASYVTADGSTRIHHGVDVAYAAGDEVVSPVGGEVRFAGRVPGGSGGTVGCVTLETERGTVTLMPLVNVTVSEGERVQADESIGTLAESGDESTDDTHLHVGLKRGTLYVDASCLLVAPTSQTSSSPEVSGAGQPAAERSGSAAPQSAGSGVPVVASEPVVSTSGRTSSQNAGAVTSGGHASASSALDAPIAAPSALPAGVTLAEGPPSAALPRPVGSAAVSARVGSSAVAKAAPRAAARSFGLLLTRHLAASVALLAALLAAAALLVTRRSLNRRISGQGPMSDRLGTLLQHLKAGDTLCGLTSCSGPLPSQSRGH